jgi:hypothetical protein
MTPSNRNLMTEYYALVLGDMCPLPICGTVHCGIVAGRVWEGCCSSGVLETRTH